MQFQQLPNCVQSKILKVFELTKRGIDGEKQAATNMLRRLLDKYNLTIEDLSIDIPKERLYKYTQNEYKELIGQIIASIIGGCSVYCYPKSKLVVVEVTDLQHVQIMEMIDFHLTHYKKERKKQLAAFKYAYYSKHNLFHPSEGEAKKQELTKEERDQIKRAWAIMETIDKGNYRKKLNK